MVGPFGQPSFTARWDIYFLLPGLQAIPVFSVEYLIVILILMAPGSRAVLFRRVATSVLFHGWLRAMLSMKFCQICESTNSIPPATHQQVDLLT